MVQKTNDNFIPDRSRPGLTTTAYPIDLSHQGGNDKFATGVMHNPNGTTSHIKITKDNTIIGTWNIRTLYASGKVKELEHALKEYQWDVIGLAETHWIGFGEITTEEGHKIWYSGKDDRHQHGVGFIVHKGTKNSVISCTPLSDRLISIRLHAKPLNITILQVYAPTSSHDDDEVEEFYEHLETQIKSTPKKDILVVQGDWNAKIGSDAYKEWNGTVGKFGIGSTNDRGLRLLEFAKKHNLCLANTLQRHKFSRTATWHAPNGQTHNQIDFILFPQRFKSSINRARTRTFPGADIGSDHDLVMSTIKLKLKSKKAPHSARIRFDLEKLKDPQIAEIFQAEIGGRFAALNLLDSDVNTMADDMKNAFLNTADEILGKQRHKKQPWVTNEALDLCDKRKEIKRTRHDDAHKLAEYHKINKEVRQKMKEDKEKWLEERCDTIDVGMMCGNSKVAYDTLKVITKTQQSKAAAIEDKKGKLLTSNDDVLERWSEYCQDLYNHKLNPDTKILLEEQTPPSDDESPDILREEVIMSINSLKTGKSPGIDNVPSELLKTNNEHVIDALHHLCQKIWKEKKWPTDWTKSLVIPLPKKGNLRQCQNYRTISLISHPSKVMLGILLNRLKSQAEEILAEEQAGFRARRSTTEQIFNCKILIEKHLQHQKELFHNFIDFKKAFDRVWHDGLWHVLNGFCIEKGLISTTKALYDHASSAVLMNNAVGREFEMTVGVRQGCLLSPILFNLYLERIMRTTLQDHQSSISISGRKVCNLRFADDIDLIAGSNQELQELTDKLNNSANAFGMEISTEKSKVMVNSNHGSHTNIAMNGQHLEEVDKFKYLGATITSDGTSSQEIKQRIIKATATMSRLHKIWKSKISIATKIRLYRSLVVSVLLYGCESWTLVAETERRIQTFETKSFRKILGISYRDRKTNEHVKNQIYSAAGPQEPLLVTVKRRKLGWFGHITRHDSLAKTIMQGTVEGGRKRGRQRKSWSDNIKDWTDSAICDLTRTAEDRVEWRKMSLSSAARSPRRRKSWDE